MSNHLYDVPELKRLIDAARSSDVRPTEIHELRGQRIEIVSRLSEITRGAAREGRQLRASEQREVDALDPLVDQIDRILHNLPEAEAARARSEYEHIIRPGVEQAGDLRYSRTNHAAVQREVWDFLTGKRGAVEFRLTPSERRDLAIGTAAAGGNLVPTSFLRELYDYLEVESPVRQVARVLPTSSGEPLELPRVASHGTAAIVGEGTALAENDPTFGKVTLGAYKYGQLIQVTREMIDDSGVDILSFVAEDAGRALGRVTGLAYTLGAGGANAPQGFVGQFGTAVTGQNGATGQPTYNDLVDMVHGVISSYRRNGAWLASDSWIKSVRKLKDSNGHPLFEPSLQAGQPPTLLGYPVVEDPNMATLGTGTISAAFGDWRRGFIVRDVGPIRFERSDEFAFDKDIVTFRAVIRTDSDVMDNRAVVVYRGGTA